MQEKKSTLFMFESRGFYLFKKKKSSDGFFLTTLPHLEPHTLFCLFLLDSFVASFLIFLSRHGVEP